ncbi:unnamed protein product [Lymnaea stagnalis]|uniref:Sulfotransferase domain-containing protein n=1 Tax=Lymnaea stagnalis TaxID=6523 RepID=A0AAV2HKE2_LYMST
MSANANAEQGQGNSKDHQENKDVPEKEPLGPPTFPKLSKLTDRFGNTFFFGNAGDYWHIPFPIGADNDYRTHARNIRSMEIRADDVIICSYPKTGLHWHIEILHMLKKQQVQFTDGNIGGFFLDKTPTGRIDALPSPRLVYTHVPFRYIPRQALEKKIKIVYLDRNPKDVLVSYYNFMQKRPEPYHYPGTFEHFYRLCMEVGYLYGDLFDYLMEWQKGIEAHPDCPIYTSVFEDMKLDPVGGVKKLNEFLATGCSDELCEQIAVACSFTNMKEYKEKTTSEHAKSLFKDKTLATYRKGEVGDWKNWFTVTMNEEFDAEYKKRMSEYKTVYRFTLDDCHG